MKTTKRTTPPEPSAPSAQEPRPKGRGGRRPIPPDKLAVQHTIRLRPQTYEWIKRQAAATGLAPGDYARSLIEAAQDAQQRGAIDIVRNPEAAR